MWGSTTQQKDVAQASPVQPNEGSNQGKAREEAIRKLLDLCASKEVEVPDNLRAALLGEEIMKHVSSDEEEGGKPKRLLTTLLSNRASEIADMDDDALVKEIRTTYEKLWGESARQYQCRLIDGSYTVTRVVENDVELPSMLNLSKRAKPENSNGEDEEEGPQSATQNIETVATSGLMKVLGRFAKSLYSRGHATRKETKVIAEGMNLCLDPGKLYLVLGLPGSGKSTLLKMIANTLPRDAKHVVGGKLLVNGMSPSDKGVVWANVSAHIDQIDRLHPYLTVWETCRFAWDCRVGSHRPMATISDEEILALIRKLDQEHWAVEKVLEGMGLTRVKDTFVGDTTTIRGVSGGERKRVTVAELLGTRVPIMCCDEISTGLDAATTYDIMKLLGSVGKMMGTVRIVSLLQPPPETVALFDEVILVDSGRILYAGPVGEVVEHFESLGYKLPDRTDVADWLLALPTKEGAKFRVGENSEHLTSEEFKGKYDASPRAQLIRAANEEPWAEKDKLTKEQQQNFGMKYRVSTWKSMRLVVGREMLLWWRDRYQIKARLMQDLVMGIVAGTVFWQQSDDPQSVMGILFQSMFFVSVGAMLKVPGQFEPRSIFYKQQDANFFPTWTFVAGRSLAGMPTSLIDGILYGSIIYWFVGLNSSDGLASYFQFMLLLISGSMAAGLVFSIFSATVRDRSTAQACMSVCIVLLVLFSGFTVQPNVIPDYWIWAYWINMFAWVLRGLVVNEYTGSKYDAIQENGLTLGENVLIRFGFVDSDGVPFTSEWIWWGFLFAMAASILSVILSTLFLAYWRFQTGKSLGTDIPDAPLDYVAKAVEIPYLKVNLAFTDIHYFVKASTTDEELELLKGVTGYVEAGKMTALMGSSGAGKTTLMDCLSLRKTTGRVTGGVTLNGHPQEPNSFRRCTGYVEQFDVQSPALTIRETVEFSARLRLDENDPAVNKESITKFIDQTLAMLELTVIQNLQVGSDMTGGLSFEQRKRLSIAVELVANPSVLFLDEPTSGLDARAAGIVMRGLKRIALTGRAVCATIHQPSIAIFNSFDSLLLLRRGGEVVYFGDLGEESSNLIQYLERFEATPKIQPGENPATWMLTCIGAGSAATGGEPFDYVAAYKKSKLRESIVAKIDEINAAKSESNKVFFVNEYAASKRTQLRVLMRRVLQIYWRSPSYNNVRLVVSGVVALLFGSVYASQRTPTDESDMNSRVTSVYITFIFLAVNAYNTVLSVFEVERNMFYRHKAAKMYTVRSILIAFLVAEIPFILLASMIFCVCFYFLVGFSLLAYKFFLYYLFFTLNLGAFTFLGQMMVSLVRDSQTAQGFGGLIISMTSIFAGALIRPNNIEGFWVFAYWLFPGHYVLEGLLTSQYYQDDTPIEASVGTPFYDFLVANPDSVVDCPVLIPGLAGVCGTAEVWIFTSFGGRFLFENIPWNILYLLGLIIGARIVTFFGLAKLNYLAK